MSHVTGANLPPETLSHILECVPPDDLDEDLDRRRKLKRGLAGPGVVCKYWSEAIRPILFQELELRSPEDIQLLKNIISSPGFAASCLSGSIKRIYIPQEATGAKSWLHHLHGLSARLHKTRFICVVENHTDDAASTAGRWAPFKSIPTVAPSYVGLTRLTLRDVVFTSKTELIRLVHNFSTLESCSCERLIFLDPPLAIHRRRPRRRSPPTYHSFRCVIKDCKNMVAPIQATLAADIVDPARRMGLDDHTWDMALQGLLSLVPNGPGNAVVTPRSDTMHDTVSIYCSSLSPGQSESNHISAVVRVRRSSAGQDAGSPLVHIGSINLTLQLGDVEVANTLGWDALRRIVDSPHMRFLCIDHDGPGNTSLEVAKRILCSVLCRSQLTWALDSGKLQFKNRYSTESPVTRTDILSVPTEHTISGTTITLDIAEQAEWLLRPTRSLYFEENTKEGYLRKLARTRTGGASTDGGLRFRTVHPR